MAEDEDLDFLEQSGLTVAADDARIVTDFGVGSSGVGPVMGFASDDFFPSVPYEGPDLDSLIAGGGDAESP